MTRFLTSPKVARKSARHDSALAEKDEFVSLDPLLDGPRLYVTLLQLASNIYSNLFFVRFFSSPLAVHGTMSNEASSEVLTKPIAVTSSFSLRFHDKTSFRSLLYVHTWSSHLKYS